MKRKFPSQSVPDTEQPFTSQATCSLVFHCNSLNIQQIIYLRTTLESVCSPTCPESLLNDRAAITIPWHLLVWPSSHAHLGPVLSSFSWSRTYLPGATSLKHQSLDKLQIPRLADVALQKQLFGYWCFFYPQGIQKGLHRCTGGGKETKQLQRQPATVSTMDYNGITSTLSIKDHSANTDFFFLFQLCNTRLTLLSY